MVPPPKGLHFKGEQLMVTVCTWCLGDWGHHGGSLKRGCLSWPVAGIQAVCTAGAGTGRAAGGMSGDMWRA